VRDYLLTLLVAAAVTYLLTPLIRRVACRTGAMKQPRDRDVHVVPVPTVGGLAMYGGLAAALMVADQIPLLRTGLANTGMFSGLLLAGGLLVVIGFIDDRWGMDALPKAAGQVAAGGILVATGTSLSWLPLPGGSTYVPTQDQATFLTILVVVATINAVNFIDGLDGLAAGIVCIAAVSFFLYYYSLTKVVHLDALAAPALVSAILIGMCLGFLPHNFSPATIFMGDTGSMLLGLLLAYAPIASITSLSPANLTSQINRYPVILPLLLPAALLVIPYGDMLLAVVRRTRAGRSPFAPDRKHLHHRLLDIGHSQRASVLIMYLWAAAFSGSVVWLSLQKTVQPGNSNHHGAPVVVFVLITVAALAVLLLLSMPRLRWWQRPRLAAVADAGAVSSGAADVVADAAIPAESRLVGVAAAPVLAGHSSGESGSPAAAGPDWPNDHPAGLDEEPGWFAKRPRDHVDQPSGNGSDVAQSLEFWREVAATTASDNARSRPVPADDQALSAPGSPAAESLTAESLTADPLTTGRSVIGTPPPAVTGRTSAWRLQHRTPASRPPETSPPAEAGPDGLT
jgi:UDP-GlcNAc:undecaprenyl-phosphate/decaprenyl-phosphate GlcNAc-1-phosphate transferase